MGGYPSGLRIGQETPYSLPVVAHSFNPSGGTSRMVADEASRKLLLEAFPGLAGMLDIASIYPHAPAVGTMTLAPRNTFGLGAGRAGSP